MQVGRAHALRGARALTIATLLAKCTGFVGQVVLARLLAPGEFGLYVFAIGVATIGIRLASFDARRDVLRCDADGAVARTRAYLTTQAAIGLVIAAVLGIFGASIVDLVSEWTSSSSSVASGDRAIAAAPLLAALAFLPFCESLRTPLVALLERDMRFSYLARLEIAGTVVQVTMWVVLASMGAGPWALVAGTYSASLLRIALAGTVAWPRLRERRAGVADFRSVRSFGSALWLVSLLAAGFWSGKDVLAGAGLGLAAAGLFGMAFEIPRALLQVAEGWSRVGLALLGRSEAEKQKRVTSLVVRGSAALLGPAVVVGVLHPELVLRTCFGERWVDAAPALRAFMILAALEGTLRVWADVATTRGRPSLLLIASAVTAVTLPIFAASFMSHGLAGLAWAVCCAWAVPIPFGVVWAQRELGVSFGPWLRPAMLAVTAALVVGGSFRLTMTLPIWAEFSVLVAELLVYAGVILRFDPELGSIAREVVQRRRVA